MIIYQSSVARLCFTIRPGPSHFLLRPLLLFELFRCRAVPVRWPAPWTIFSSVVAKHSCLPDWEQNRVVCYTIVAALRAVSNHYVGLGISHLLLGPKRRPTAVYLQGKFRSITTNVGKAN